MAQNNFIIISRTYAETTPESAEIGDFSKKGFIAKKEKVTFSQLVALMKDHTHPSQCPNDGNINVWYSSSWHTTDYNKGTQREESLHFHRQNTSNASKYWKLARKYADK